MNITSILNDSSFMGIRQASYMLSWSKPYVRSYLWYLILLFFLVLVFVGISLIQVDFVQRSIDAVLVKDWRLLLTLLLQFSGITAIQILRNYVYGHYANVVETRIIQDVKDTYSRSVMRAQVLEIEKESEGDLITRHNNDIPVASGFIKEVYSNFLLNPLMALGGFLYLMHFNWQLSLVVFLPLPIITLFLNHVSNRASRIYAGIMESLGEYTEEITDISRGAETIKAYNMQDYKMGKVKTVLGVLFDKETRYNKADTMAMILIMLVSDLPQVVSLVFGGMLVLNGVISVSVLVAYFLLIQRVNTPTVYIFSSLHSVKNAYQSMKRLDKILGISPERTDGSDFSPDGKSVLTLHNVSFGYENGKDVLKDVSFELECSGCIGIAGDSGAGKSTIVDLISGFYQPDNGLLAIHGEDLSTWNLKALRSHIAYVHQDAYVLPGTLLENISYGSTEVSPDKIREAVGKAGLTGFVAGLPDGLNTVLSEDGKNLSGGQRQRISLARAALRDASLYIFDEPTASLDPASRDTVLRTIRELKKTKSIILISHSPEVLDMCDHVYLLREGEVEPS